MKKISVFGAALALCAAQAFAAAHPTQTQPNIQKVKVGDAKLKGVDKKDGKLKDGKLKTPLGKAKMSNGKVKLKL